jgi:hypothetical protein
MRKLTLTLIGKDSEIASAKENLEDFMGIVPFSFNVNTLIMEQVEVDNRDEYVVNVIGEMHPCGKDLEKALSFAMAEIARGVNSRSIEIHECTTIYIDNTYQGVKELKNIAIRLGNVVKSR